MMIIITERVEANMPASRFSGFVNCISTSFYKPCVLTKSVVAMEDCESKCVSSVESDVDAGV